MGEKKTFAIKIGPDGNVSIASYCLRTDSWHDYLAFMRDAELAAAKGSARNSNRYLRAALSSLFSHIDGVANAIGSQRSIPNFIERAPLCDRTFAIGNEARKHGPLPYINFRIEKHLRNLIAHPPFEQDGDSGQQVVFEKLDVPTLRKLEKQIDPWLDAVCKNLGVDRFTDTEVFAKENERLLVQMFGGGDAKITEV